MTTTTQLYLAFNTVASTEDRAVTVKVDSIEHARQVVRRIGEDRIESAEVYCWAETVDGPYPRPVACMNELFTGGISF